MMTAECNTLPANKDQLTTAKALCSDNAVKVSHPGQPLVTVITVVFNCAEHIDKTIQSVISNSYKNLEYIIIDGGSTDGTVDIINKYGINIDFFSSEKDDGIYHAMNKGLDMATGDYVIFLGADDTLVTIPEYDLTSAGLLLCDVDCGTWVFRHPDLGILQKRMRYRNSIHPQGTFYKRSRIRFNTEYRLCADYLFNLEYMSEGMNICYSDCTASRFSVFGASSKWEAKLEIIRIAYMRHGLLSLFKSLIYHVYSHVRSCTQ